jgi:hypothetical protein
MQAIAIILLCVAMAVAYGIVHDQITARICVEYFTIGHPPVFGTEDPTLLGLGWGVIATWWVGVLLGVPLAAVARLGSWPKRTARSLVRPLLILMMTSAVLAFLAGFVGYRLSRAEVLQLHGSIAESVPAERHAAFIADLCAHSASYAVGFVGGGMMIARVGWKRWKAATTQ